MEIQNNQTEVFVTCEKGDFEHHDSKSQNTSTNNMPKLNAKTSENSENYMKKTGNGAEQFWKSDQEADEESTNYGHSIDDHKNQAQSQESWSPVGFPTEMPSAMKKASTPVKPVGHARHSLNYK